MSWLIKILTVVAAICGWLCNHGAEAETVSFNISDPGAMMPTRCLATGRACVGEQSLGNGLLINPAALASPSDKSSSAWNLNIGNVNESLNIRPQEKVTIRTNEGSVGWALGWGKAGVGLIANVKNSDSKYSSIEQADSEVAKTNSQFGSVAIRAGFRLLRTVSFGISYGRYALIHDFRVANQNSDVRLPKLENSYFGNAPTLGFAIGTPRNTSFGLVFRPQVELSQSGDNLQTSGDAQRRQNSSVRSARQAYQQVSSNGFQSARIYMPAKTTLGLETVMAGNRALVFRSDLSMLSPVPHAYRMDPNYLMYLSREADLSEASRQYQFMPGLGLTAALPSLFFFDQLAVGAYYDETHSESFLGDRHQTYGLSKGYKLFGWDLSFDFTVDQTQHGQKFVFNLF